MIIYFILQAIIYFFGAIFVVLPSVTSLPFGFDAIFSTVFGYVHGLLYELPFLTIVWNYILIYYGLKLSLLILRVFLGSRTPASSNAQH